MSPTFRARGGLLLERGVGAQEGGVVESGVLGEVDRDSPLWRDDPTVSEAVIAACAALRDQ